MGRRKPAAAFSLFSFQDIITSVTAILILVMLLLTIELVTRRRAQTAADPEATRRQIDATVARLAAVAERLRDDVAERRAERPNRSQEAARRELALVTTDLDSARRRLDETRRTREAVNRLLAAAEETATTTAKDVEALTRLTKEVEDDKAEADRLETANRTEQDRQAKRAQETAGKPRTATELVFNQPAESDRRAWLVELSGDGTTAVLLGGGRTERFGRDVAALARWVAELKTDGDYCLLLVRPSAEDALEADIERRLQDADIRFGIELIGEDQTVRDGSPRPDANS